MLSSFLVINSVTGVSPAFAEASAFAKATADKSADRPTTAYVRGIFHSSGGAFVKLTVNRSWVSKTVPPGSRLTFTTGNPGCSVQPDAISPTGFPELSERAFHKSAVVVFEYTCAAM